jgi:hypothetical protein
MQKTSKITGPECSKCGRPMAWQSLVTVGKEEVNVFHCDACDKLTARAVPVAASSAIHAEA